MTVIPSTATAAYQALAKIGGDATAMSGASSAGAAGAPNFSDFLSSAVKDSVGSMKAGEQVAMTQTAGQTDIVNVVTAVNNAVSK